MQDFVAFTIAYRIYRCHPTIGPFVSNLFFGSVEDEIPLSTEGRMTVENLVVLEKLLLQRQGKYGIIYMIKKCVI